MKVTLKRIIRAGYFSFRRNGWLSAATIMVMALVLFVLGNLMLLGAVANTVLGSLESKIDISIYFLPDAQERSILAVKKELEFLPDVAAVSFVSRGEALDQFREKHKSNVLVVGALEELGENPLEASLNIRAHDPSQYGAISEFLLKKNYPIVDKVNYFENQKVIERLAAIFGTARGVGSLLAVFLSVVSVLVAFNTVRLAIYTMREEIGIMRLVGATSWFIRGPFLVNGIISGGISAVATASVFLPLIWFGAPKLALLVPEFDLFGYLWENFLEFFGILLLIGVALGTISSLIAMRRYLKI